MDFGEGGKNVQVTRFRNQCCSNKSEFRRYSSVTNALSNAAMAAAFAHHFLGSE
jgi:hypothetical protein